MAKASGVVVSSSGELTNEGEGELLALSQVTRYRGLTARANFLALDRADIKFAVKELARRMATPRSGDMDLMKRLGKYLVGTLRAVYMYPWQSEPAQINTFVDSDWAGCKGSWRSTSGDAMMSAKHIFNGQVPRPRLLLAQLKRSCTHS